MQTRILLPEPDDWTEGIPYRIVCAYFDHQKAIQWELNWYLKFGLRRDVKLTSYDILRKFEVYMPRGKKADGKSTNNGSDNGGGKGRDAKFQWANCRLTPEDIATLAADTSSLDYLAACLCSMADDGFGISCKPASDGKSLCCTIIRSDFPAKGYSVGVSAFGGNIRDAILTCLYKLTTYGGEDFSGFDLEDQIPTEQPRFR